MDWESEGRKDFLEIGNAERGREIVAAPHFITEPTSRDGHPLPPNPGFHLIEGWSGIEYTGFLNNIHWSELSEDEPYEMVVRDVKPPVGKNKRGVIQLQRRLHMGDAVYMRVKRENQEVGKPHHGSFGIYQAEIERDGLRRGQYFLAQVTSVTEITPERYRYMPDLTPKISVRSLGRVDRSTFDNGRFSIITDFRS